MIRFAFALIAMVFAAVSVAHAQGTAPPSAPPATPQEARGGEAVAQDTTPAAPAPQYGVPPPGAVPITPQQAIQEQGRQHVMRGLQEEGRVAYEKARAMQATDPAGAQKVMLDYHQARQDKMKALREAERAESDARRLKMREDMKARQQPAPVQPAPSKIGRPKGNNATSHP